MKFDLKGVAKVQSKGRIYYYAWRGGPRLRGEPGTPAFIASYNRAIESHQTPDMSRFRYILTDYKGDTAYKGLSESTRKQWSRWLDRISESFGELRIAQFNRTEKIRPVIRSWRNRWSKTPRTADYGMQVLSRVMAHGVELGKFANNPCEGIKRLYKQDRSDIIWTAADISDLYKSCSQEIEEATDLARYTGLRRGDLIRMSWSHVGDDAIVIPTSKSGFERGAIIPLYDVLRQLLARIPQRSTTILTSSRKRPWSGNGLGSSFNEAKRQAGLSKRNLHFNDLRGTAATNFYLAGFTYREIAETMAWEEKSVERIIRKYVGNKAAINEKIRKMADRR